MYKFICKLSTLTNTSRPDRHDGDAFVSQHYNKQPCVLFHLLSWWYSGQHAQLVSYNVTIPCSIIHGSRGAG